MKKLIPFLISLFFPSIIYAGTICGTGNLLTTYNPFTNKQDYVCTYSGTFAQLNSTQTWSGINAFSTVTVNGQFSVGTSKLAVLSNGNVGIGTTTPAEKLTIQTAVDNYGWIHTDGTRIIGSYLTSASAAIGTKSNHPLAFFTNNGGTQMTLLQSGNVGIGTTTPNSLLTVKGDIGTVASSSPTITSCGTSPALRVGSTDTAGEVTEGSVATGCTITFAVAKTYAPFCTVSFQSGLAGSYTLATTGITITNIGALSSTKISYVCITDAH